MTVTALVLLSAAMATYYQYKQPLSISLKFQPVFEGEKFNLNSSSYPNLGGEGSVVVRSFQFFISNIALLNEKHSFVEPDSYHLARFDQGTGEYEIVLNNVPRQKYSHIELSIGVDQEANESIRPSGDLDPNGRMAWNWEVGYKFLLIEGMWYHETLRKPLVYHIGFNESYHRLKFPLTNQVTVRNKVAIAFEVGPMVIFSGSNPVDMQMLPTVKFNKQDAARLSSRFPEMVKLKIHD